MSEQVKRPKGVLVILILTSIYVFGVLGIWAILSGLIPVEEAEQKMFNAYGFIEYTRLIVIPVYLLYSAIMLFRLKQIAIKLYIGYGIFFILNLLYSLTKLEYRDVYLSGELQANITNIISILFIVFLVSYPYILNRKGLLRP